MSNRNKERMLKSEREKYQVTFRSKPIRLTSDFSAQTLKSRSAWNEICQPRLLCPSKLSFKFKREIKTVHDKNRLKEFMTTKPAIRGILQDKLHTEEPKHKSQVSQIE